MGNSFDRRDFLKQAATAGLTFGVVNQIASAQEAGKKKGGKKTGKKGKGPAIITKRIDNVPPSERLQVAVVGVNGRGAAHANYLASLPGVDISHICEVDSRPVAKVLKSVKDRTGSEPAYIKDYRKLLEDKDLDAVFIATPDHWHATMSIMALAAGKNVYSEKPATHNPYEGELLVQAVDKYKKVYQMGNQRRSFTNVRQAIEEIQSGKLIGKAYYARCCYSNARAPINFGKQTPVPEWLGADGYDLWQGPAPRRAYKDNVIHYNWHWFWHWGTGEALNNGTHELDNCRWALGVDYPSRVVSSGGRYHFIGQDDWECPDTQVISMEFPEGKGIMWEGRSCNDFKNDGIGRGSIIHGTEGSVLLDNDTVVVYDLKGKEVKRIQGRKSDGTNTVSTDAAGDLLHFVNFLDSVRGKAQPNSPVAEGVKSCLAMHLGNIALRTGGAVKVNPETGQIMDNPEAMKLWKREYEKGWEPMQFV